MPFIPEAILNKLRCVQCKKWLSCGPIRLLPNGGSICGRCHTFDGPREHYRHFAFEALACYFEFPCKYWEDNCPEWMPFKKVEEHEKKCSYGSGCGLCCSHPSALFKSRKYLNPQAAINLELIPDEVLEYLRCSNCAGYLSSAPVLVCRDGTSICYRCSSQLPQPNDEFIQDLSFEVFADIMIFPCIYRYRGCTQLCKFGDEMMEHEIDCSYGQPYQKEPAPTRNDSIEHPGQVVKEKGVLKTHSGHIYATITPNRPLFAPPTASRNQTIFLDEFQRHRENLTSKWGNYYNGDNYDYENEYANRASHTNVIDELKVRQYLRNSKLLTNNGLDQNSHYESQNSERSSNYGVYQKP